MEPVMTPKQRQRERGRPRAGIRTLAAPSSSSLFQIGSMKSFLEQQGYGESSVLSSDWQRSRIIHHRERQYPVPITQNTLYVKRILCHT
jgi:hypothetical protein